MAAPAAYTLRELLKDASKHALPVGPDSAATAARVHELLEAARTHSDAAPAGKPGLQNPAPLPNTLLRVETLAKAVEALGLIVASRLAEGHAVRIKGFALFFHRRFGHGIRLPQFQLDDRFAAVYGISSAQSAGRVPETVPEKVSAAQVATVAHLSPELAATAVAVVVGRLGETMQSGALVSVDIPYLGTMSSRGARVEMAFRRELATDVPVVPSEPPVTLGREAVSAARRIAATTGAGAAEAGEAGFSLAATQAALPGRGSAPPGSRIGGGSARLQPGRRAAGAGGSAAARKPSDRRTGAAAAAGAGGAASTSLLDGGYGDGAAADGQDARVHAGASADLSAAGPSGRTLALAAATAAAAVPQLRMGALRGTAVPPDPVAAEWDLSTVQEEGEHKGAGDAAMLARAVDASPRLQAREARAYPPLTELFSVTRAAATRDCDVDPAVAAAAAGSAVAGEARFVAGFAPAATADALGLGAGPLGPYTVGRGGSGGDTLGATVGARGRRGDDTSSDEDDGDDGTSDTKAASDRVGGSGGCGASATLVDSIGARLNPAAALLRVSAGAEGVSWASSAARGSAQEHQADPPSGRAPSENSSAAGG
ncbi:hypothetical protein FNF29_00265 [Cafeteria roenbergensis]|uniref:CCDC81 HU domain-containing protein n=1 Tax=Cafeteria roenbergensis TaxID=33653 RepID=A0A5A8D004_CAFRO|nr:hypothetical protein FNF29_00265 [Cafeteria roenbergensis]|eukprot:KAA0157690.1 hypothetical protein FNF29_00265 [Cafeteria roenbergensis]